MTLAARLAAAELARAPARTLVRVLVLAAAVALLGAMLLFIGNSLRSMTASAVRSVLVKPTFFSARLMSAWPDPSATGTPSTCGSRSSESAPSEMMR